MADDPNRPDPIESGVEIDPAIEPPPADGHEARLAALNEEVASLKERMLRMARQLGFTVHGVADDPSLVEVRLTLRP